MSCQIEGRQVSEKAIEGIHELAIPRPQEYTTQWPETSTKSLKGHDCIYLWDPGTRRGVCKSLCECCWKAKTVCTFRSTAPRLRSSTFHAPSLSLFSNLARNNKFELFQKGQTHKEAKKVYSSPVGLDS